MKDQASDLQTRLHAVQATCAAIAVAVGIAVLLGWILDVAWLKSPLPGQVTMKVNTALGFVLAGVSLHLLRWPGAGIGRMRAGQLLAVLVTLIGLSTLAQHAFDWELGIDQWLLPQDPAPVSTSAPVRMAEASAIAFSLLGPALLALDWSPRNGVRPTDLLALALVALSTIAGVEYLYGHASVLLPLDTTRMAVHTCVTFLVLGLGTLAARPGVGIVGAIRARMAGTMERRIYVALLLSLLALLVTGATSFFAARDSIASSALVDHTHTVRRQLALLLSTHQELQSGARGYLISGDTEMLKPFERAVGQNDRLFHDLGWMMRDNPAQLARLEQLDGWRQQHLAWAVSVIDARRAGQAADATRLVVDGHGERLSDRLRASIMQLDDEEARLLREREARDRASVSRLNWTILASTALALLVVGFAGLVIHRDFIRRERAEQTVREQNEHLEQRVRERTAQLQTVLEHLDEGVAVFNLAGGLLHLNRAALAMLALETAPANPDQAAEQAKAIQLYTLDGQPLAPADWPLQRVLREERLHELEYHIGHRHDGWRRTVSFGGSLARDAAGRPLLAVVTLRDVTRRKQAELRINTQLEHLRLLDHITRATGERQDLNSIFQVVVRSLEESLPIDFGSVCLFDAASHRLTVTSVGAGSAALAQELALAEHASFSVDANGMARCIGGVLVYEPDVADSTFPFPQRLARAGLHSLVLAPLKSVNQVFGVLIVARRASDAFTSIECEFLRQLSEHVALAANQAQLHGSLQQAYDDLRQTQDARLHEERLRALGQMASGVAHDINNALSPVSLYTESLLETEPGLSNRARGYLETIQRAVDDVAQTVARMREFYRKRDQQLELAPVDVNMLIRQVMDLTRARWSDMALEQGITIAPQLALADDLPPIMGVESEIRDALTNLVFNAVDAMPAGGTLQLRTRLRAGAAGNGLVIEVIDDGIGMDEPTRRQCLEPFFTTKGQRGTGLGLAMVFGMVQRHSCDLEVDSAPGQGTTMRLTFAIAAQALESATGLQPLQPPPRLRLLLIDDDPILLRSMCDALHSDGHQVDVAGGGVQGIAAFHAASDIGRPYQAVLTDLGMPHVDGRQVAAAIRLATRTVPIIMLTGWGQRMVRDGETPTGVDLVLAKPPKLRELRAALAQLCGDAAAPP